MTWLTILLHYRKALVWCKHHWKILAIALWTLIVFVIARKNVGAYKKVLDTTIDSYNKEVEVLQNSHDDELQKRNEVIRKHGESIDRLEKEYSGSKDELDVEKRSRYLELLSLYGSDPDGINEILEREFGFKHVE